MTQTSSDTYKLTGRFGGKGVIACIYPDRLGLTGRHGDKGVIGRIAPDAPAIETDGGMGVVNPTS